MKRLRFVIMLLAAAATCPAQDGSFVATTEQTTVGTGEQFQVSFTLSGSDVNSARNFRAPDFSPFVVLSGPNQSTSVRVIGGQVSGSLIYSYYLYARQPGKYTIASASIEYRGTTLRTEPIQIEVVQDAMKRPEREAEDQTTDIGDNLFIRALADRQRVRQGEQITITYRLYTRLQVAGYDITKAPVYQGFWSEEIEQPRQPAVTTETVEGKQYRVATIRKTALFPTQTGKLTVPPLEVRCAVQVQSRRRSSDPFDAFFNDPFFSRMQTVEHDFRSNPLTVTVDPLPGISPAEFKGAVGKYSFTASVDKNEVKTGDPITLKLVVAGSGNIKLLSLPAPNIPGDFEAYDPKVSEEITRDGGIIRGQKTAEYLIIPRNPGERAIEPMTFAYFDVERNTYTTLRSPRFEFTVTRGREVGGASVAAKSDIRLLGDDIRYLKLSLGEVRRLDESPLSSGWFLAGLILPPLAFLGAVAYRRYSDRRSGNVLRIRFEKAGKEASKRLKQARKLLGQGNTERYHAEISKALMGYLEDKLHIPRASLALEQAVARLQDHGVDAETAGRLRECIERAEFARFAPVSDTQEARLELLEAAAGVINMIENSFTERAWRSPASP